MKQKNPSIQFTEVKNKFLLLPLDPMHLVKTGLPGNWQENNFSFDRGIRESQTSLQKYYQSMYCLFSRSALLEKTSCSEVTLMI